MNDILGRKLEVGDEVVACVQDYRANYDLVPATIDSFTPKMVRISRPSRWSRGEIQPGRLISPNKLVKVEHPK